MTTKNTPSVPRIIAWIIAIVPLSTFAQSAQPSPQLDDDLLVLNPFVVNVSKDRGFVAASSLAGGRLAGELKDTPVAYSVLTRDFIDALQLTDVTEMTKWFTNALDLPNNNSTFDTGTSVQLSARGVSSGLQRDFFPVSFNFDGYNVERLDLARGPNAILFGAGGTGGTINSVTKRARADTQISEVRTSYGSWDNFRTTIDFNRSINKTFGIRLNAVYQDRQGWQDNDMERRKGATLSATWKVAKNTEIRVEAEKGWMDRTVIVTTYRDQFSAWDGKTVYSVRGSPAANATGFSTLGLGYIFTPSNGIDNVYNYQGWVFTRGGNTSNLFTAGGIPVVGTTANIADSPLNYTVNLPANLYDLAISGSNFRVPPRDYSLYPDGAIFGVDNQNYTISLTQRIGDNLFIEAAANMGGEDTRSDIGISRQMSRIYIDVNTLRPDGSVNPNFLEPYTESRSWPYFQTRDRENARLSVGYKMPKTRYGEFNFNMITGISNERFDRNAYLYVLKLNADPRRWPSEMPLLFRYYLNTDNERPLPRPDSWNAINPITNTTQTVAAGNVRDYQNAAFNQLNDSTYTYIQAAVNAKLLKGRLNLLLAARQDRYDTTQNSIVAQFDNPTDWDGQTRFFKPAAPSDWAALTYRQRNANGTPFGADLPADTRPRIGTGLFSGQVDPLYANDRFRDDYSSPDQKGTVDTISTGAVYSVTKNISAFINYAESFTPPSIALKIDGSLFVPSASKGWDYGLRFASNNGEIVANVIRYTGRQDNRSIGSAPFNQAYNTIIQANALQDLTLGGLNSRGLQQVPQGYVDSSEATTEGWELEITANLTPNWRLILNGALPRVNVSNQNKESIDYFRANEAVLRQIVIDAGGTIGANNVATFTSAIPPGQSPSEGPNAATAWNTLQSGFASILSGQKANRVTERSMNLFTDYTFRKGSLSGLRVGGGLNYRGREVIGSKGANTIRNPVNPVTAIDDPDVGGFDMVYREPYTTAMLTFNYTIRLPKKSRLVLNLNIDNVFDYAKPIYYNTILRPEGGDLSNPARVATPNQFAWLKPRNYTLSATLNF